MPVTVKGTQFHLRSKNSSYIISVFKNKYPIHLYWGEPISDKVDLGLISETVQKQCLNKNAYNSEERRIKLKGLKPDAVYECNGSSIYSDELMKVGATVTPDVYDYNSELMFFKIVEE